MMHQLGALYQAKLGWCSPCDGSSVSGQEVPLWEDTPLLLESGVGVTELQQVQQRALRSEIIHIE